MIRIILRGCNGRMGKMITAMAADREDCEVVAGLDLYDEGLNQYPVYDELAKCGQEADVVIDVSSPKEFEPFMEECIRRGLPVVECTTGLSESQLELISKASERIALLRSANMSMGINTVLKLLRSISSKLTAAGFDIDIVERHHNQKLDAPSGTAIALADAINETLPERYEYVYDRSQRRERRPKNEIGISAVRGGTIVGEHEVIYAGCDEVIEIKHTAYSRAVFATGAVQAALFLAGKPAGRYDMSDVLE